MPKYVLIKSHLPAIDPTDDPVSNGFVFLGSGASDFSSISDLFAHVAAFYTTAAPLSSLAIGAYFGTQIDRGSNHCTLTAYDITGHLNGTPHGSPVAASTFTCPAASTGGSWPMGVAACLSWRADYGTDVEFGPGTRPRSRDRNRIYLGPLNTAAQTQDATTHRVELSAGFINDCLQAAFVLSEVVDETGADWVWQVWSRVNAGTKLPTEAFMDNRPDYQRRRSDPAPGSRTFLPLSSV